MSNLIEWWGYRHSNGGYQVKRYFEALDITEAQDSPFVAAVAGPFEAENRENALAVIRRLI